MEMTETAFFRELPFLKGLSPEHLAVVTRDAWVMQLESDQTLFDKDAPAHSFFLILSGRIAIMGKGQRKGLVKIQTLAAGDAVGWSWMIPPHLWRFRAVALEPSSVLALNGVQLREACERDPSLGYLITKRMVGLMASRLEATLNKLAEHEDKP
jgi:CRP/FNR family transcriptional regulator, cyclic AMP receptor protein